MSTDVNGYSLIEEGRIHTGAAISVSGTLVESPGGKQKVRSDHLWSLLSASQAELKADRIVLLGDADPADYPLQKKRHSLEFLRSVKKGICTMHENCVFRHCSSERENQYFEFSHACTERSVQSNS